MKCFYSWSGDFSKEIAEQFSIWFRGTLQTIDIFFSPEIEKGTKWLHRIHKELDDTEFGFVFITIDNYSSPWILYESGAIAKRVSESRLYTILIDCKPSDISGPLSFFQHTKITKTDISKLIFDLNTANKASQINQNILTEVIDSRWNLLEEAIKEIINRNSWRRKKLTDREIIENLSIKTDEILGAIHGKYDIKILDEVVSEIEDKRRVMEFINQEEDDLSTSFEAILKKIRAFYSHIGLEKKFDGLIENERKNNFYSDGRFVHSGHD